MNFKDLEKDILGISSHTLTTGLVGTLSTVYFVPGASGSISIAGMNIPAWVLYAAIYSGASGSQEALRDFMKRVTPNSPLTKFYEISEVNTGIMASFFTYLVSLLSGGSYVPSITQLAVPFGIGFASDYVGKKVSETIINPMLDIGAISKVKNDIIEDIKPIKKVFNDFNPMNMNGLLNSFPSILF